MDYRDARTGGPAVVWPLDGSANRPSIKVVVKNTGRGDAEAIEVRFDRLGATQVFNESGNISQDIDQSVHPPRFTSGTRVLNSGDEWVIARLSWYLDSQPGTTATWSASARGMRKVTGTVELEKLDAAPVET